MLLHACIHIHARKQNHAIHTVLELGEEIWACEINFRVIGSHWAQECIGGEEI